ncbi:MAG: signal recognition particle-docking protein FtsY [Desulfovibrio sp.]|nr:signal recognition particle-docking protein FtsY [Desulfovibrio sp.]
MGFFSSIRKVFGAASHSVHKVGDEGSRRAEAVQERCDATAAFPVAEDVPDGPQNAFLFHAPEQTPEQNAMTLALRRAEPRLSAWLAVVLEGVEKAGDLLWERIRFLLTALEAPPEEVDAFITTFRLWLEDMEYERLEDFRSELQYRLALALDVEDEEDERNRLIVKLSEGLAKTREHVAHRLNALFLPGRAIDASFWEELEEILIMADVGFETANGLTERLRRRSRVEGVQDAASLRDAMRLELLELFRPVRRISALNPPEVVLVIGVNGAGKTTTIAKLCHRAVLQGKKVMLAAGDTFRAAAIEQLAIWAKRAGAGFYAKGHGADPAAVAYEALDAAFAGGYDTLFVDTAGRLQTKTNLMEELVKIGRVLGKRHPGAPHRTILVLDATVGQNGLSQVKLFHQACGIDELIITKLDGTAKGGIAVAAAMRYDIPISFVGLGEKMEDLRPFDAQSYVAALLEPADGAFFI